MGTFNTEKILYGPSSLVPEMARRIRDGFSADGFDVKSESLSSGDMGPAGNTYGNLHAFFLASPDYPDLGHDQPVQTR